MPLILKNSKSFSFDGNNVTLNAKYIQEQKKYFKKITGTRFGAILNMNKYCSPFKCWLQMVNLFKEEIDEKLSKSGQIIEPLIIKYVEEKLNTKYISHDPIAINFDIFSNNKIFGGIPDGEPINEQNKIDYSNGKLMLEIKTSSIDSFVYRKNNGKLEMVLEDELPKIKERYAKRMTWFAEDKIVPPTEYVLQLGLYLYLRDLSEGAIVVSFLNGIDYIKPQEFVANDHEIHVVKISMDKEKFSKYINFATEWYNKHILTGISPPLTKDDAKWFKQELDNI